MGLTINDCKWLARALVNMKYQMIISHGPSTKTSMTTNENPILGVGQGATDALAGWLLITKMLSKMYNRTTSGCKLILPTEKIFLKSTHTMFVDDAYLFHASSQLDPTPSQLQKIVQNYINEWDQGLESTGGKLNGDKTNYVILQWLFTNDGMPYLDTEVTTKNKVSLTARNTTETIKQIALDKDTKQFEILGVRTPPTLQDNYELEYIYNKSKNFAIFFASCPLTRKETWVSYSM